ncbi:MAG: OmpA family protein [Candidatus Tectomicrobia bacterium]|uniref:OmpA family protein n=1 Tax=Tectimicrobiota bacterium TaxID=2528274 RepID=A0A932CQP1_UNCTE|nr:OmpA family protein [Candidatus Tectomicrobia bacterium]
MSLLKKMTVLTLVASLGVSGCANWQWGKRETGAVIGAAAGAAIGAAGAKRQTRGAIVGGAMGALAGGLIGWYLDKQEREMEQMAAQVNAQTVRQQDQLVFIMPSGTLFDTGSAQLNPGAQNSLREMADMLKRYPHSDVVISGHTDNTGSDTLNQRLSQDRAEAVKSFLVAQGVDSSRILARGFGENMPVTSNETAAGRQQNRRVEITVKPRAEELVKEYPGGPVG